jgi:hypothetical protein
LGGGVLEIKKELTIGGIQQKIWVRGHVSCETSSNLFISAARVNGGKEVKMNEGSKEDSRKQIYPPQKKSKGQINSKGFSRYNLIMF